MILPEKRKSLLWTLSMLLIVTSLLALSGCGTVNNSAPDKPKEPETAGKKEEKPAIDTTPVTLRIFLQQAFSDEDVKNVWIEPLQKKYPFISLEVQRPGKGVSMDSLIAAGETPDILFAFNGILPQFYLQDLLMDMSPLVKKYNVDLQRFDPAVMDSIKAISKNNGVVALPFSQQFAALYYNKNLFDRFGVTYPKDGMYWEDAIELAKKLSRFEGNVKYAGLDVQGVSRVARPLAALKVDAATEKAAMDTPAWRKAFDLVRTVYTIPNNERPPGTNSNNRFLKDKTLAMFATVNILDLGLEQAMKEGLDWDLAEYPSYKEAPHVSTIVDSHIFSITKTSKHPDQAMLALQVFTSEETQLKNTRMTGRLSILNNKDIIQQLGQDMPFLKGKHMEAIFKSKIIPSPVYSKFEFGANSTALTKAMDDYVAGKDINTTLRDLEETINNNIAKEK